MGDWIGLGFIVLLVIGALFGLSYLGRPRKPLSNEEYEQRVRDARGTMRAGAFAGLNALEKLINPKAAKAIEAQQDLKAGYYNDEEKKGEGDEPGHKKEGPEPKEEGGDDA